MRRDLKTLLKTFTLSAISFAFVCSLTACTPRGENRSVDEVLKIDQARFAVAVKNAPAADTKVGGSIVQVKNKLDEMVAAATTAVPTKSGEIAGLLSGITMNAGYTSRPSLDEMVARYRELSATSSDKITVPQVKLLVARTYSLLASELETTKFAL
jgi:hypothetical protein